MSDARARLSRAFLDALAADAKDALGLDLDALRRGEPEAVVRLALLKQKAPAKR